jgi:hypothetical protein
MTRSIMAFAAFWYDFIVGDDWRVAVGVVTALGITYGLSNTAVPTWWVLPTAVLILLPLSLWRASHTARATSKSASSDAG